MTISPNDVKVLREKTGAGMMDCKKALGECNGDMEKAVDYLRAKGLAAMQKRQGKVAAEGVIGHYIHSNGKIGVLVELNCETDFVARNEQFIQLAKDLCMQVAAADPKFLKAEEIDDAFREREIAIYTEQLKAEGKPANMIPKIVEGKLKKMAEEVCLYNQKFVKDPDKTVQALVQELTLKLGEKIEIRRFVKLVLGEGIEKKQENFAEEVAKMSGSATNK
ncbi:MAG: translation elongation factor Ts [Oligoflexia bacterium]|nr:translation elongation factor Ts [Oligoflexia bacterium]MBF0364406.1 translation elongation factor Ts [Oligoflexia bacterium]